LGIDRTPDSRALAVPTSLVRKKLPPKSPEKPTLTKAVTSRAEALAIRRSQARQKAARHSAGDR
jgi:hypothetical protein